SDPSPFNSELLASSRRPTSLPDSCNFRASTNPSPPLLPLPQITPTLLADGYCDSTNSATAVPAFSMSVSEGTPNRLLVTRSISRISSAVTIFMPRVLVTALSFVNQQPALVVKNRL